MPTMFRLRIILLLASCLSLVCADLKADLTAAHVESVFPGDAKYSNASAAFNLRFEFHPAAVTYPTSEQQVSEIVEIGNKNNVPVVARSGGHSYIANGIGGRDGSLVVDVMHLKHIDFNKTTNVASVGTGNKNGDIAQALVALGRDVSHGTCPYVGLGGHVTYGGYGYASRIWGLALDDIVGMDAVLPDGRFVKTSDDTYQDVYWALRGAGGSFGIVTTMHFRTHEIPKAATTYRFNWILDVEQSIAVLLAYQNASAQPDLPNELGIRHELRRGLNPGTVNHSLTGTWNGPADQFNAILDRFLKHYPEPVDSHVHNGTYLESLIYHSDKGTLNTTNPDDHDTFYAKSLATPQDHLLTEEAITKFVHVVANQGQSTTTGWFIQIELWGSKNSAINTFAYNHTSFVLRNALFVMQFYTSSHDKKPPFPQEGFEFLDNAVDNITSTMPEGWEWSAYTDYIDGNLTTINWQHLYYGENYRRLRELKRVYDPSFIFGKFPTGVELY
ncbi:glucooligosaccharide oxidase [Mycena haematopus]|nr:glucooligosaccharide oxidase [Mycena haematopus]